MSRETAAQLLGKPLTQVLTDGALLTLGAQGADDLVTWFAMTDEQRLGFILDLYAPLRVTSASYSPKKGGRYQLAIAAPRVGSITLTLAARDIDPTGLHAHPEANQ